MASNLLAMASTEHSVLVTSKKGMGDLEIA